MKVKPMGMLLMMLAGWINRHQQDVIMLCHIAGVDAYVNVNNHYEDSASLTIRRLLEVLWKG